ncbi:MFS transporter [Paraburkholderia bengalensis]|uniref:MFS transporter n=1 Tax=Paraburkholderia bengalensis TaxID=2747562 RepID=A0ABU8J154_9BURK
MDRRLLTLALGMFALGPDCIAFAGILRETASSFHARIHAGGQPVTVYALSYASPGSSTAAVAGNVARKGSFARLYWAIRHRQHCYDLFIRSLHRSYHTGFGRARRSNVLSDSQWDGSDARASAALTKDAVSA